MADLAMYAWYPFLPRKNKMRAAIREPSTAATMTPAAIPAGSAALTELKKQATLSPPHSPQKSTKVGSTSKEQFPVAGSHPTTRLQAGALQSLSVYTQTAVAIPWINRTWQASSVHKSSSLHTTAAPVWQRGAGGFPVITHCPPGAHGSATPQDTGLRVHAQVVGSTVEISQGPGAH